MNPTEHLGEADRYIQRAKDADNPQCSMAEAQIAQTHLIAAGIKMAHDLLGKGKHPAINMGLSLLKLAK